MTQKLLAFRSILLIGLLLSVQWITHADNTPKVITAENMLRLQSVKHIDFDDLGNFISGWFALSGDGETIVVADKDNHIIQIMDDSTRTLYQQADFVTGYLFGEEWIGVHTVENTYEIVQVVGDEKTIKQVMAQGDLPDYPSEVYVTSDMAMIEVQPLDSEREPYVFLLNRDTQDFDTIPYVPAQDEASVVRIGRIPAPYTVTSTLEGIVKLWDWSNGILLTEVNNGIGEPSVFGNINADATQLVWRDNANENLYILNFATSENRKIDALNGEYAQWYFLTPSADVILAVNLGFQPNVVSWNVATSERTVLGTYRSCSRPQPDMARLSKDGTTLVIGCDSGLDIWRVVN